MRTAIIGGNHYISSETTIFEHAPLEHAMKLMNGSTDLILFFDQLGIKTFDIVDSYKNLPLVKVENFFRRNELPQLPENTRLIFENSLRNYSRRTEKLGRETALQKNMFREDDNMIKCNCVGIVISLIEILFKNYESVILVADKKSSRLRVSDVVKTQLAIPALQVIWI